MDKIAKIEEEGPQICSKTGISADYKNYFNGPVTCYLLHEFGN